MRTTRRILLPVALAAILAVGACSGDDDETAEDDVATLGADDGSDENSGDGDGDDGGGGRGGMGDLDPEFQDAMLEFAECMRDEGIDFPDPQFTEDGGVMIGGGVVSSNDDGDGGPEQFPSEAEMEEMEAAQEICEPIMEEVRDSMPEPDPEQIAEMQDQALEFAQCMRDHGIDMPDPEFGEGGRISQRIGGPGGGSGGGFDPNDEEFQEAAEECGGEGGFGFAVPAGGGGDEDDG